MVFWSLQSGKAIHWKLSEYSHNIEAGGRSHLSLSMFCFRQAFNFSFTSYNETFDEALGQPCFLEALACQLKYISHFLC